MCPKRFLGACTQGRQRALGGKRVTCAFLFFVSFLSSLKRGVTGKWSKGELVKTHSFPETRSFEGCGPRPAFGTGFGAGGVFSSPTFPPITPSIAPFGSIQILDSLGDERVKPSSLSSSIYGSSLGESGPSVTRPLTQVISSSNALAIVPPPWERCPPPDVDWSRRRQG